MKTYVESLGGSRLKEHCKWIIRQNLTVRKQSNSFVCLKGEGAIAYILTVIRGFEEEI